MPTLSVCTRLDRNPSTIAAGRLHTALALLGSLVSACATTDDVEYGETQSAISVGGAVDGGCSTSVVVGLARQIADEVDCTSAPNTLVRFTPTTSIRFTSNAVLPYLNGGAKADLVRASASGTLRVNSGYRTLPQQYLLYRWFRAGRCGIARAATPGTSNHESARAVDLANWSSRIGAMARHGWAHDVPGDSVHFDHLSSPDIRGRDVRAFQRLWNRNHPNDRIAVDGDYGRATAARLRRAPAKGFAKGSTCHTVRVAEVVAVDGADRLAPASVAPFSVTIANGGDVDWPADARLVIADGTPSELYDAATWVSPTEVGPIGVAVAAGGDATLDFQVATPAVTDETPLAASFAIVAGGQRLGAIDFAVTVTPNGDAVMSNEPADDEEPDPPADPDGVVDRSGCTSGRGLGWLAIAIPAAVLRRRRR